MSILTNRQWVLLAAFLMLLSATIATNAYLRIDENDIHHDWVKLFLFNLINWYLWLLAIPIILVSIEKYRLFSGPWIKNWIIHLLLAIVILVVLSNIRVLIGAYYWNYFDPLNAPPGRYLSGLVNRLLNDWFVYVIIMSILTSYLAYHDRQKEKIRVVELSAKQVELKNQLETVKALNQVEQQKRYGAKLPVKEKEKTILLDVDMIYSIEAYDNYVKVHLENRVHLLKSTLKTIKDQLGHYGFIQVHRSHLVNMQYIESIEALFHGEYLLQMKNQMQIKLTRSYRKNLDKILNRV